jgi:DNA-binding MarR family transcriptional regulator
MSRELQELDIGSGQYSFLINLFKKDGISQESLVEALGLDKGTTARAILNLSEKGYIKREIDPDDRRSYRIYLTEKAFQAQPRIDDTIRKFNEIIMSGFSESDREIASQILNRMAENIVRHFQKFSE